MVTEARPRTAGKRGDGGTAVHIPLYRSVRRLARDPLGELEAAGRRSEGAVARLNLGLFRPYLLTHPEHVHHFFVTNPDNYRRDGLLWTRVRDLLGDGLAGEGDAWEHRHNVVLPLFSAKYIASLIDVMAEAAAQEIDALDPATRAGQPVDLGAAMVRIVNRVVVQAFFGGRIAIRDAHWFREVLLKAFTSQGPRMLLPFVPGRVPLPGDRAHRRAAEAARDILTPLVEQARREGATGMDVASMLCRTRDENGDELDDARILHDLTAMFVASGETAPSALTWLWVLLDRHPEAADRMADEVTGVVGTERPRREHFAGLSYTKLVLQEVLRLYPPGWILPRRAIEPDTIGGVRVEAGSTVIASPYITHRMPWLWDRPEVFDPERFSPANATTPRHKYAYFPFGGGPHGCLGANFFNVEAQVIVSTVLSRYRVNLADPSPIPALPRVSLRPARPVMAYLRPIRRP